MEDPRYNLGFFSLTSIGIRKIINQSKEMRKTSISIILEHQYCAKSTNPCFMSLRTSDPAINTNRSFFSSAQK